MISLCCSCMAMPEPDCWHQRLHFRGSCQVFYDQRSHGRSSRSEAELCRIPQLADDLHQVLEEVVGSGPVIVIGHSMGGMRSCGLPVSSRTLRQSGSAASPCSAHPLGRWRTTHPSGYTGVHFTESLSR